MGGNNSRLPQGEAPSARRVKEAAAPVLDLARELAMALAKGPHLDTRGTPATTATGVINTVNTVRNRSMVINVMVRVGLGLSTTKNSTPSH